MNGIETTDDVIMLTHMTSSVIGTSIALHSVLQHAKMMLTNHQGNRENI